MKRFSISAFFPEVIAHRAYQICTVEADEMGIAARRGIDEIRRREGIAGRRLTTVKLTIAVIDEKKEKP